jgi:hypothetical protein
MRRRKAREVKVFDVGAEATGFIAIGQFATGVIALGQFATGIVAVGQLARGVFVVGQLALGVAGIGQLIVTPVRALGQVSFAWDARGLAPVSLRIRGNDTTLARILKLTVLAAILIGLWVVVVPPLRDLFDPPPAVCTDVC